MTRLVKRLVALAILAAAAPAAAQIRNALDREAGVPAGLSLPVFGAAVAEEPSALELNPAGIGFVRSLALQYFHEKDVTKDSDADAIYAAWGFGGASLGYQQSWVRPGPDGHRYRRSTWALALGDGRSSSVGAAWNRWTSPNAAIEALQSFDVGLTIRPARHFSFAAVARDLDATLGNERIPIRYDVGLATRFLDDTLTLSGDLIADDRGQKFRPTHGAVSGLAELKRGIALGVEVQFPLQDELGIEQDVVTLVSVSWNAANAGWTGGALSLPSRTGSLIGLRASGERYRATGGRDQAPIIDVEHALEPKRTLFLGVSDADPFSTLVRRLEQARDDADVGAVVMKIDDLPISYARVEELRALVEGVRARKPVLAYLRGGGTVEYYLATAASHIAAPPTTTLTVNGLATSQLYLKEGLERLGVAFEVVRAGRFKSATEPLTRTEPSPEAREMTNALLDDVFARVVKTIADTRKLPEEKVRALVDRGLLTGEQAVEEGLVDVALWPDELEDWVRARTGVRASEAAYRPAPLRAAQRWGKRDQIALVLVEGAIVNGPSRRSPFGGDAIAGSDTIAKQLRKAADDGDVRAIVVRIDSPGGDGFASDLIWRELVRARKKGKPVVASMGDVAASGGYLVAAGADAIVAEPSTLTGSIGVFALKPDVSALLGKLSIRREGSARGATAELFSVAKPWTEPERKAVEAQIDRFYAQFKARVAEGRKMSPDEVEAVASGRVWTGAQARDRRLVDRLGTLADAIALARERAGLRDPSNVEVVRTDDKPGPLGVVLTPRRNAGDSVALRLLADAPALRAAALVSEMGLVLALPEEWVAGAR